MSSVNSPINRNLPVWRAFFVVFRVKNRTPQKTKKFPENFSKRCNIFLFISSFCVEGKFSPRFETKEETPAITESFVWEAGPALNYGQLEYEKLEVQPWYSGRTEATSMNMLAETETGYYMCYNSTLWYADKANIVNWVPVCNNPSCGTQVHPLYCQTAFWRAPWAGRTMKDKVCPIGEHKLMLFDGQRWRSVELPEELRTADAAQCIDIIAVTSDKILISPYNLFTRRQTRVIPLYTTDLSQEELKMEWAFQINSLI